MKHNYTKVLSIALLLFAGSVQAQVIRKAPAVERAISKTDLVNEQTQDVQNATAGIQAFGDTITGMYWDFASGFPSG
ncbi:MAG: hypothetical protein H6585_03130 [Flavobacteriales bacterium]|nr:hypothetical protein [Flavobacteriales bacterium]MCB9447321.1 hypothetical protein [Flavobacteriales bacterium]